MTGNSTSMFNLQQLRSDYLQQQTQWFTAQACYQYSVSLKTIICASHRDHFTLWSTTLMLASLRGC